MVNTEKLYMSKEIPDLYFKSRGVLVDILPQELKGTVYQVTPEQTNPENTIVSEVYENIVNEDKAKHYIVFDYNKGSPIAHINNSINYYGSKHPGMTIMGNKKWKVDFADSLPGPCDIGLYQPDAGINSFNIIYSKPYPLMSHVSHEAVNTMRELLMSKYTDTERAEQDIQVATGMYYRSGQPNQYLVATTGEMVMSFYSDGIEVIEIADSMEQTCLQFKWLAHYNERYGAFAEGRSKASYTYNAAEITTAGGVPYRDILMKALEEFNDVAYRKFVFNKKTIEFERDLELEDKLESIPSKLMPYAQHGYLMRYKLPKTDTSILTVKPDLLLFGDIVINDDKEITNIANALKMHNMENILRVRSMMI